jgi:hypothetical protein
MSITYVKQVIKNYENLQQELVIIEYFKTNENNLIRCDSSGRYVAVKYHPRLQTLLNNYFTDYYNELKEREDEIKLKLDALSSLLK